MTEITLFGEMAKFIDSYGVMGVILLFIAFLIWQDKRREDREERNRQERQQNEEADRFILTNHLSAMIKDDSESKQSLAVAVTRLSDSVNNFQSRCGHIQTALQNEVDRLMKK